MQNKSEKVISAWKERKRKWNVVFGSVESQYIIKCLEEFSGINRSNPSDSLERMEGRKEVMLYIKEQCNVDLEKIKSRVNKTRS